MTVLLIANYNCLSKAGKKRNRIAVIPYFYEISPNLKACARQIGVDTVFSSDFRSNKSTPFQTGVSGRKKAYRKKSVCCETGVVYEIPLEWGFKYARHAASVAD